MPNNQHNNADLPWLVIGLGQTGLSVVRYLTAQGYAVVVADSRQTPPMLDACRQQFPEVEVITGNIPFDQFDHYAEVVASPGIGLDSDRQLIGDIELFVRHSQSKIVAITGSNGKSTVTMLVSKMLAAGEYRVATGGNIGTPALDLLQQPEADISVLELSSFQLETTWSLAADCAALLNISADHMDRYRSIDDYLAAKARILEAATVQVIGLDDPLLRELPVRDGCIGFTLAAPSQRAPFGVLNVEGVNWLMHAKRQLCQVADLALAGQHNIANVLAAMALLHGLGIELDAAVIRAACEYRGLPHRCELIGSWQGVNWINDSKGTNVGATEAALQGFDGPLVLIAGGRGKDADFASLKTAVATRVDQLILFGEDAPRLEQALGDVVAVTLVNSLEAAVCQAKLLAQAGQSVLFSPACSSFDMFENYAARGDCFRQLVLEAHS